MTLALREDGDRLDVERAAAWLARCKNLDDVRSIRDRARAIEVYHRSRGAALDAQQDAAEIALRAERRLGELCSAVLRPGRRKRSDDASVSLEDLGISKDQSSRWQKLASVPEDDFDHHVAVIREKGERLTTAGTIRATSDAPDYDGDSWGTPPKYLEAAREVLGEIDLDPASNVGAQRFVRAKTFYTAADDGLSKAWAGRVWLNPPYSSPLVERFTTRFVEAYESGALVAGIVLVNNTTDTDWCQELLRRFPVCLTDGRIPFLDATGKPVRGTRQGQAFFYAGEEPSVFAARFEAYGAVLGPLRRGDGWAP